MRFSSLWGVVFFFNCMFKLCRLQQALDRNVRMKPYLGSAAVTARASTLETKIDFTNYVFKRTHSEKTTFLQNCTSFQT